MRKLDKKLSKKLQKSLSDVICRIKTQTPNLRIASTTSKLINGCRHPQSPPLYANGHRLPRRRSTHSDDNESETALSESAAIGARNDKTEATLEDIDRFLFENFRSLYSDKCDSDREEEEEEEESFETPDLTPSELYGSRRFFVSPTRSRSSLARSDEAGGGTAAASTITARSGCLGSDLEKEKGKSVAREDCIAVLKATADPIEDFRRSMRQVMEARERHGEAVDWGFMEELLFCYLRLNEKRYYRFVLDAFVDSVVEMRRSSCDGGGDGGGDGGKKKGKERKK